MVITQQKHRLWILFLILGVLGLFFIEAEAKTAPKSRTAKSKGSAAKSTKKDSVVAKVNGFKIYEKDLKGELDARQTGLDVKTLPGQKQQEFRKQALEQLIGYELLYQDALTLGIAGIEDQVEKIMVEAEKQYGSKQKLEKELAKEGMNPGQVRSNLKKNLYIQAAIQKEVVGKVQVTEEEVKAAYEKNKDKFKHEELIQVRHILVRVPDKDKEEEKKKALEKIQSIKQELQAGKDFAELAQTHSDCPSKARGGDLGYVPRGATIPEFEKVAFSLKEGEVSDVVETVYGYHLILVYGKKPAGIWPLEEVKEQLEAEQKNEKIIAAINGRIQDLRKKAKVEILDKKLAADRGAE